MQWGQSRANLGALSTHPAQGAAEQDGTPEGAAAGQESTPSVPTECPWPSQGAAAKGIREGAVGLGGLGFLSK